MNVERNKVRNRYWKPILGVACLILYLLVLYLVNRPDPDAVPTSASLRTYLPVKVLEILADDTQTDTWTEGRRIGTQRLKVELLSGDFKGEVLTCDNYVGAYSNVYAKEGSRLIVQLDTDENGEARIVTVYNHDRGLVLAGLVLVFAALLVVLGGKRGLMALIGLVFTLVSLWFLLIPLMRRGAPPIAATVGFVALTTAVSLLLLSGFTKKTLCAVLGCVGGVAAAGLCAAVVGGISPLNGFNFTEAEGLVLLAKDDGLTVSGLLVSGILISALGAVMDVAMSISSACSELVEVDPKMDGRRLFRSGMNIGRDAMGTMANTLILAFAGSSLCMLILFQVYGFSYTNIFNSDLMMIELLQGVAGSIGILLTVPLVAVLSARILPRGRK